MTDVNFSSAAMTSLKVVLGGVVGGFCYSKWYRLEEKSTISLFMFTFYASYLIEQIEAFNVEKIKRSDQVQESRTQRIHKIQIISEVVDILVLTTALMIGKRLGIFGIKTTLIIGGLLVEKLFWIKSSWLAYRKN